MKTLLIATMLFFATSAQALELSAGLGKATVANTSLNVETASLGADFTNNETSFWHNVSWNAAFTNLLGYDNNTIATINSISVNYRINVGSRFYFQFGSGLSIGQINNFDTANNYGFAHNATAGVKLGKHIDFTVKATDYTQLDLQTVTGNIVFGF